MEIFQIGEGYGYRVEGVYQEFDPDCDGFVPMSEARARECAQAVLDRLNKI